MLSLTPEILLRAYSCGVFPMARSRDDPRLYWIDPPERGILPLDDFHIPRSLAKVLKRGTFEVTIDQDFAGVLRGCGEPTPDRPETWINDEIIVIFTQLHEMGLAHSVETRLNGELVGGLYGLALGGAFFGESMFSRATDASKVALAYLVGRLVKGGFTLLDTQFVTDHLRKFGAREIPKADYLARLSAALSHPGDFYRAPSLEDVLAASSRFRQSSTQTS